MVGFKTLIYSEDGIPGDSISSRNHKKIQYLGKLIKICYL